MEHTKAEKTFYETIIKNLNPGQNQGKETSRDRGLPFLPKLRPNLITNHPIIGNLPKNCLN